jgi:hypothetical protein
MLTQLPQQVVWLAEKRKETAYLEALGGWPMNAPCEIGISYFPAFQDKTPAS